MAHDRKEIVKKLETAYSFGADVTAACSYASISRQLYYLWLEDEKGKKEGLKEKFDIIREKPMLKAYKTIFDDLDKPETAKWFAERKRNKEFTTRQEIAIENDANNSEIITRLDSILDNFD